MTDEIDRATERNEQWREAMIKKAVNSNQSAGNGICRLCDSQIEEDRLKVIPHALHCAECAAAVEDDRARMAKKGAF